MVVKLPTEDSEIIYCWICRKYHLQWDRWCPWSLLAGFLDGVRYVLAHSIDWYIIACGFVMIIAFTFFIIAIMFNIPVPMMQKALP